MPNWQAVSKEAHASAGWRFPTNYRHAQNMTVVPVFAAELGHLLQYYPLAFVKDANGQFQFERMFKDSTVIIKDVLFNEGFERYKNNELIKVSDSMIPRYSASVNSVHYFSVLPFGLNDAAVKKQYIGKVTLKEKPYHKIKITFNKDGGGEDFEDVFVYWINTETHKTAYIAYLYHENHGIGLRFREAYNERYVEGVRFVDYNNYKPEDASVSVLDLDDLFEKNQLQLLTKIELTNLTVVN